MADRSLVERSDAAVDALRDELVAFTSALVRTPSVSGYEQAAQRLIADKYASLGLATDVVASDRETLASHPAFSDDGIPFDERLNVVGRWRGTGTGRSLILNGHMDVVPPGDLAKWTHDPWSGEVVGDRLHGRGSCDMKAGLAAAAFAVQALQTIGVALGGDVLLQSVIGEETGGVGTLTTILAGYRADACVIMEPMALRVCPVHAGALSFRLTVHGRSAHASNKPLGVNAIVEFLPLMMAIERLDVERHGTFTDARHPIHALFDDPRNVAPIIVGTLRAGDWPSSVPDLLIAEGRLGVFPDESADAARAAFVRAIHDAASASPWLHAHPPEIEWFEGQFDAGSTPLDADIVRTIAQSHADAVGAAPAVIGLTAGTDLRLFTRYAGIPTVMYGPGALRDAHTVDESVPIAEIVTCAKVLARTMLAWCAP